MIQQVIFLFFSVLYCQIRNPDTGELAELKYHKQSGQYFLFGLDMIELTDGEIHKGKFISMSDSIVVFKTDAGGGMLLEKEIQSIKNIILENSLKVIDNYKIDKKYITVKKSVDANNEKSKIKTFIAVLKNPTLLKSVCGTFIIIKLLL